MSKITINLLIETACDLQEKLASNAVNSQQLVSMYLQQIEKYNPYLRAVIETAPATLLKQKAYALDKERQKGLIRGPLHGIPILLKDNIATVPALGLGTTCGSLALVGSKPRKNAVIVERLLASGAIILGKTNLSEWNWYRSEYANSGWSAVGGQTQSAYVRGGFRTDDSNGGHSNPGGSSSGSAVGVSAGFAPVSIGTETAGSLVMPSDRAALYTIKPTVKIVSQEGIIPISPEADSAGPMAKSVLDLANLLDILVDRDKTNVPLGGYRSAITGTWDHIKIGILEPEKWLTSERFLKYEKRAVAQMFHEWRAVFERLKQFTNAVKWVQLISLEEATDHGTMDLFSAFHFTFQESLESYLSGLDNSKIHTLEELIQFNQKNADQELPPSANNQIRLIKSLHKDNLTQDKYNQILAFARKQCREKGIDKTLQEYDVDVIIGPGESALFYIAAGAGYPVGTLPLGYLNFNGRPFGLQIIAKAHQEALIIQVQSAWEKTMFRSVLPELNQVCRL